MRPRSNVNTFKLFPETNGLIIVAALAGVSGGINILALTAPIFMLQVYDRVLTSRCIYTLIGLAVITLFLYAFQFLLDVIRNRVLLRIGENFDLSLSKRVRDALIRLPLLARQSGDGLQPLRDLDNIRGFLSGQGPAALFDLPWVPLYLAICFLFHFWIGMTALTGAIILISVTFATHVMTRKSVALTVQHNMARFSQLEAARSNAEIVQALGLREHLFLRCKVTNDAYLKTNRIAGDLSNGMARLATTLRTFCNQRSLLGRISGINAGELNRTGPVKIVPGMPAEALIQTKSRSALSYLIKPLADQIKLAFREE